MKKRDLPINRKYKTAEAALAASKCTIKALAVSREGDLAISGDQSGQVNIWNLKSGELIDSIFDTAADDVSAQAAAAAAQLGVCKLAMSHSNLFSLIAFTDNTVRVYDNELCEIVATFPDHGMPVKHMYVFEDSHKVLSSDGQNSCKIWLADTGQLLESITVDCSLFGLAPDGRYAVSGPGKNKYALSLSLSLVIFCYMYLTQFFDFDLSSAKIWALHDAKVVRTIDHPERIGVLAFTRDSHYVITGGDDNSCKIWELSTGKLIQVLIEHDGPITSIAVPNNNLFVVTGSKDKLALIWSFRDGCVLHKLPIHNDYVSKVATTIDGSLVITATRDSTISVWSSRKGTLITSINLHCVLIDFMVSLDGTRMIASFKDSNSLAIIGLTNKTAIMNDFKSPNRTSVNSFDCVFFVVVVSTIFFFNCFLFVF